MSERERERERERAVYSNHMWVIFRIILVVIGPSASAGMVL